MVLCVCYVLVVEVQVGVELSSRQISDFVIIFDIVYFVLLEIGRKREVFGIIVVIKGFGGDEVVVIFCSNGYCFVKNSFMFVDEVFSWFSLVLVQLGLGSGVFWLG